MSETSFMNVNYVHLENSEDICWFCKKLAGKDSAIEVTMSKYTTDQKSIVYVPRCHKCKRFQNIPQNIKAFSSLIGGVTGFIIGVVASIYVFTLIYKAGVILISIILPIIITGACVYAGAIGGYLISAIILIPIKFLMKTVIGIKERYYTEEHPYISEMKKEGWAVNIEEADGDLKFSESS